MLASTYEHCTVKTFITLHKQMLNQKSEYISHDFHVLPLWPSGPGCSTQYDYVVQEVPDSKPGRAPRNMCVSYGHKNPSRQRVQPLSVTGCYY